MCRYTRFGIASKKRLSEITRQMSHGTLEAAQRLLECSDGGSMLNTAFIERLNGTMRERLATLTRKCRHAAARLSALQTGMYLLGCTYNLCWPHQQLSYCWEPETGRLLWVARTPAMASGLTDHVWTLGELLSYKVAPSPWVARTPARTSPHTATAGSDCAQATTRTSSEGGLGLNHQLVRLYQLIHSLDLRRSHNI